MEAVRAVVIGFGGMGSKYAHMLYNSQVEGMTLAGICCRNEKGQKIIKEYFKGAALYQNVEEMFSNKDQFDAVIIVTPHDTHVEIAIQAARAGKHILMDKPAGVCTKEVKKLLKETDQGGVELGLIFNTRRKGAFQTAKRFLEEEGLGKITRAVWLCNTWYRSRAYHNSAHWRSTWKGEHGGLLINQCQHYLDVWQWLLGMPDSVYASIDYGKYNDFSVDDSFDLQFCYHNGMRGTFISASGESPGVNRLEIWGTRGRLTIENGERLFFDENEITTEEFNRINEEIYGIPRHQLRELETEDHEGEEYSLLFGQFARHLLSGEKMDADGKDGLNTLILANGAYLSSWLDKKVSFPIDDDLYARLLTEKAKEDEKLDSIRRGVL